MKRCACFLILALLIANAAFAAEPIRIAVLDFTVRSNKQEYTFLGKGFAEFTAIELARSKVILIIERERRNEILKEIEFSLSDLAYESKQIRLGKLLSAQYIVTGDIFELAGKLIVTVQVLDVEQGVSIFKDKVNADPGAYDYIVAALTTKVLTHFNLKTPEAVAAKAEKPVEKPAEAVVRFSDAVDALDRNDKSAAKEELNEARKLDPASDAIRIYLSKLTVNTAKFEITLEAYFPVQNPAYLGIIQYDTFNVLGFGYVFNQYPSLPADSKPYENDARLSLSYQFPIGSSLGLSIEATLSEIRDSLLAPTYSFYAMYDQLLGILGFGWAPTDTFSWGVSFSFYTKAGTLYSPNFHAAVALGIILKNSDSTFIYDIMAGVPIDTRLTLNVADGTSFERQAPMYLGNTMTFAFLDHHLFLILKQLNEFTFDHPFWFGTLLAAFECWLTDWLAFRVVAEGSLGLLEGNIRPGYGGKAGIARRIPGTGWAGWDLNIDISYRQRPSRIVGSEIVTELIPSFSISKTASFISR